MPVSIGAFSAARFVLKSSKAAGLRGEGVLITEVEVDVESAKGKASWNHQHVHCGHPMEPTLGLVSQSSTQRWDHVDSYLYSFRFGTSLARPNVASAEAVADRWISDVLDAEAAKEYTTAEEGCRWCLEAASELLGGSGVDRSEAKMSRLCM